MGHFHKCRVIKVSVIIFKADSFQKLLKNFLGASWDCLYIKCVRLNDQRDYKFYDWSEVTITEAMIKGIDIMWPFCLKGWNSPSCNHN